MSEIGGGGSVVIRERSGTRRCCAVCADKGRENGIDKHRYTNFERVLVETYQPRFDLHLFPSIYVSSVCIYWADRGV